MVTPNFNLFLWVLLFMWIMESIARIILGAVREEKPKEYDFVDVIVGIFGLIVALIIFIL